jgi:serine protease Do
VSSIDNLTEILSKSQGTVRLEGIYPGFEGSYAYPLNLKSEGNNNKKLQEP